MRINLDNLACCGKCGIIFDITIIGKEYHDTDYERTLFYRCKCPNCECEWDNIGE